MFSGQDNNIHPDGIFLFGTRNVCRTGEFCMEPNLIPSVIQRISIGQEVPMCHTRLNCPSLSPEIRISAEFDFFTSYFTIIAA